MTGTIAKNLSSRGRTDTRFDSWPDSVRRVALALLLVGGVTIGGGPTGQLIEGWAQTAGPSSMANFLSGQVTANEGNDIQINNKNYPLQKGVTITDDEGKPRDLKDLVPGAEVKFHLKNGQIDQIVLVLPK